MQRVTIRAYKKNPKGRKRRRTLEFAAVGEGRTKKLATAAAKRNLRKYVKSSELKRAFFTGKKKAK
jgi:hypothetical protein